MTGPGGFERKRLIKSAFKCIIDSLVPRMYKIIIYYWRRNKEFSYDVHEKLKLALPHQRTALKEKLGAGPLEYFLEDPPFTKEEFETFKIERGKKIFAFADAMIDGMRYLVKAWRKILDFELDHTEMLHLRRQHMTTTV